MAPGLRLGPTTTRPNAERYTNRTSATPPSRSNRPSPRSRPWNDASATPSRPSRGSSASEPARPSGTHSPRDTGHGSPTDGPSRVRSTSTGTTGERGSLAASTSRCWRSSTCRGSGTSRAGRPCRPRRGGLPRADGVRAGRRLRGRRLHERRVRRECEAPAALRSWNTALRGCLGWFLERQHATGVVDQELRYLLRFSAQRPEDRNDVLEDVRVAEPTVRDAVDLEIDVLGDEEL